MLVNLTQVLLCKYIAHMSDEKKIHGTKFLKKFSRSKAKLEKDGFALSDTTTNFIIICNAGVGNGVRREELEELIPDYDSLHTPARKSYALVHFSDIYVAEKFSAKLQGYVHKAPHNLATPAATFYIHFVKSFGKEGVDCKTTNDFRNVPGLQIFEDFISSQEESDLLNFLCKENPIEKQDCENILKNRQVWHYGYEFRYNYNDVDPGNPKQDGLPDIILSLIERMKQCDIIDKQPNQITINRYEPGHGIPPHIDNPQAFDENLLSLSLGSQTVMDFKKGKQHVQVLLSPRSLIAFKDEARFEWTHGICPRKVDLIPSGDDGDITPTNRGIRYSVTFRRVRDDYQGPMSSTVIGSVACQPVGEKEAEDLEELHVHQVYNEIASHFTATREKPWPKVVDFIKSMQPHTLVLDVGCGSGRYLGVRRDVQMVGCDKSENLVAICKGKGHEVFCCDGLVLPVNSDQVDACICIAVIHHYSTMERRSKAIAELLRVTKPGGKVLISVWALEQEYKRVKSKYLKPLSQDSCNLPSPNQNQSSCSSEHQSSGEAIPIPVHKNRTPFKQQDVLVPWHKKPPTSNDECNNCGHQPSEAARERKTFHRFYHVFKKDELDDLCRKVGGTEICQSYYDEGNWCIILKKLNTTEKLS